jgi:cytosine/adenosine deaminase-related metal-dependent hydrolase
VSKLKHFLRKTRIKLIALFAQIAARDPTVFPAREVLRMATIEGARVVGLGDEVGSLGGNNWRTFVCTETVHQPPITEAKELQARIAQSCSILRAMPDANVTKLYDDKGAQKFVTLSLYEVHKDVDERLTGIARKPNQDHAG